MQDAFLLEAQAQRMRYQGWFDFACDGYLTTDLSGIIHEANYAAGRLLDARRDFLIGKPLGLFMANDCRALFYRLLTRLAKSEGIVRWEGTVCRPHGEPREVSLAAAVLPGEDGEPWMVRWMLRDISVSRQVERALHAEKSLTDCLVEAAEIVILVVDAEGRILRCNPFLLTISGYRAHQLQGKDWSEVLLAAEDREAGRRLLQQVKLTEKGRSGILGLEGQEGNRRFVVWSARKLSDMVVLVGHDVTELQEAQRQALRAERLAAIGQMAAGLAHESRNALQRSQACLSVLELRLKEQPELLGLLARIQKSQDDLRHLFEGVRTYAATPRLQPQACDLRRTWREAWENLVGAARTANAELREEVEGMDLVCFADPFYLKNVFRNILENALGSGADPVRIVVRCRPAFLGEREAIQVSVRDNGPGFPAEVRRQLFEPFFTTKLRGTGLGLAICKRIVEAHGGRIKAGEEAAQGAEVLITIPRRMT
ncbi:MAG TPA: ATP-binding protein [Gemmataceae bacterium]